MTTKRCATCGNNVERKDCHKNRFGEYICRTCQAAGLKATPLRKQRHVTKKMLKKMARWALLGMAAAVTYVVVVKMLFNLFVPAE